MRKHYRALVNSMAHGIGVNASVPIQPCHEYYDIVQAIYRIHNTSIDAMGMHLGNIGSNKDTIMRLALTNLE